jgi:hypothetical protein
MDDTNCGTYYEHAKILNNQKVLVAATEYATAEITNIRQDSQLLYVTDESFWLNIVQTPPAADNLSANEHSQHVSTLLGVYFSNCGASSLEAFNKLTSRESLCKISRDGAIKLMEAERTMFHPKESTLTDLQRRCIQAIADDWRNFDKINWSDVELLQKQSPLVLTETISRFSRAGKHCVDELSRTVAQLKREAGRFERVQGSVTVKKKYVLTGSGEDSQWFCFPREVPHCNTPFWREIYFDHNSVDWDP